MTAPTRGHKPRRLPDPDAITGRKIQAVAGRDAERLVKGVDVDERRVRPNTRRWVRTHLQLRQDVVVALLRTPDSRPAHEEPLVAREPPDRRRCRLPQRTAVRA